MRGLDDEAATALAERILSAHGATRHQKDPELPQLLAALGGFPLALEVTLPNLRSQTPAQVLAALGQGDVALDSGKEDKTESLLRCIDYSHGNLADADQTLLLCLAPFTGVIFVPTLPAYVDRLRAQPALATLPFERWDAVLAEARRWGLLDTHPEQPSFLELQPAFPYFLRSRLAAPERAEQRSAIEAAFRAHYDQIGNSLSQLFQSKEPQERQIGPIWAELEYANVSTAMELALTSQGSIINLYLALSGYIDATQQHERGQRLGELVLSRLEGYDPATLAGALGAELAGVIDDIGRRQLSLKTFDVAERSFQRALTLLQANQHYPPDQIRKLSASIYHRLGYVAQEQRQWAQAEAHYQQALALNIEFHDRYSQASTYHNLGMVAQEQRQWAQAEAHYQQALALKIEFNDRYSQASTYGQMGLLAEAQGQTAQAQQHLSQALTIFAEFKDEHRLGITLRSLARLRAASGDTTLAAAVAQALGVGVDEAEQLLQANAPADDANQQDGA